MHATSHLIVPDSSLVFFVDETGHEELVPGHPVYGLGGCAVMARDIDRLVRKPWRDVRFKLMGSPDTPLHAAEIKWQDIPNGAQTAGAFFRANPFSRFGAILTTETVRPSESHIMLLLKQVLGNRIAEVASHMAFREIAIIFEASSRTDRLIEDAFSDFELNEDGNLVPTSFFFMPKSAAEPALEVADFVMHAVGGQARRELNGKKRFGRDFQSIFHCVDSKLTSFMRVTEVQLGTSDSDIAARTD